MKKFKIEIEFVTPYMQHRMDDKKLEEWEKSRKLIDKGKTSKRDFRFFIWKPNGKHIEGRVETFKYQGRR